LEQKAGAWDRESVYTYPLLENIGITLDLARGNLVRAIKPGSAAAKAGVQAGDLLRTLNKMTVHSFADASYGLHKAPLKGDIPIAFERDGKSLDATLSLAPAWRRTNLTWRPSLLAMLPSITVYASDLSAPEKKTLGLDVKRLAFRQEEPLRPFPQDGRPTVNTVWPAGWDDDPDRCSFQNATWQQAMI
jgi:membrane-associated protease RseP (regulator of RpoE activity)